jgi:NADPH-dependent 2,4-dienoyl-CoA reductase/sulfur reductase-like enzyme/rhodanese-related sulfurtransferase
VNATAEITILEKGPYVSFANCGLPYHLGGEIAKRSALLVTTAELFWNRFRIGVKVGYEVTEIDRAGSVVRGIDHTSGQTFELPYDRLILSTGSEPISPAFMSPPCANVRHLWTLTDMDAILAEMQEKSSDGSTAVRNAVVVGGGFVGLEVVEQLVHVGIKVTLVERNPQVLKPLDWHFARIIERDMASRGVQMHLGADIVGLRRQGDRATGVQLGDGTILDTDLVIVGAGVRPRTALAAGAGLAIGKTGGVVVDEYTRTDDPKIYAVGDMIEYMHGVLNEPMRIPLAGPANRAGRIAGAHAASGHSEPMGPVLGTSIVRVFGLTAACTGLNEAFLDARGIEHHSVIIQAGHHAGYFPGAQSMQLKVVYAPGDGKILGAQGVGGDGVDKRIDVIATAMHFGGTVYQLAQLDLAYAPPYGSAKDPVHMAAFAAINDLDEYPTVVPPDYDLADYQVVDVRSPKEQAELPLVGAIPIAIDELADRWTELDPTRPTITVCHSGKRAHVAACWLKGHGFESARNLTGGMAMRSIL